MTEAPASTPEPAPTLAGRAAVPPGVPIPAEARATRGEIAILVAIVVLAAILRVIHLDQGLWYDEVLTLTRFVRLPVTAVVTDFSSFNNHVLYSLQAKAAVALFGESAWALRLPAALFGIAGVVVTWLLAALAVGKRRALLAAFLIAISYHHVWFSQNARGYTEMLFWTALGTVLFLRGMRRPDARVWAGYAICVVAGVYTHLSAAVLFAAHVIVHALALALPRVRQTYPGLTDRRAFVAYGVAAVATGLLYAPLIAQIATTRRRVAGGNPAAPLAEWANPLRSFQEMLRAADALGWLAPVAVLVAVLLIVQGARHVGRRQPMLVAIYALHVPLTVAFTSALALRLWPRYFFVDAAFVFTCVAVGATDWAERAAGWVAGQGRAPAAIRRYAVAGMVVVLAAGSAVLLARNYASPKQDLAGAVAMVERQRAPGDIATSVGRGSEPLRAYYAPDWPVLTDPAVLRNWLDAGRRVWVVMAFPAITESNFPAVRAILASRFDLVAALPGTLGGGSVRVYRSRDR
ncbi:MAG: glycosyltransferase family 39 protein [Casimicrobiaceae bacterium]